MKHTRRWPRAAPPDEQGGSEEKVALMGFAPCPAMPAEAYFLGIISAEFIAEILAVCRAPRLHLAIHNRQTFSAERTAGCYVFSG
jgi:hypothetical protein